MIQIDDTNYELWLLRYADNDLTNAERTEVEQWLASHPEAEAELMLYNDAPRLQADEETTWEGGLPQVGLHRRASLLRYAAGIALLIAIGGIARWVYSGGHENPATTPTIAFVEAPIPHFAARQDLPSSTPAATPSTSTPPTTFADATAARVEAPDTMPSIICEETYVAEPTIVVTESLIAYEEEEPAALISSNLLLTEAESSVPTAKKSNLFSEWKQSTKERIVGGWNYLAADITEKVADYKSDKTQI